MGVFNPFCRKIIKVSKTKSPRHVPQDKPWFNDKCRILHNNYLQSLQVFNSMRSSGNRRKQVESKRKYKNYERKVKCQYLRLEGNRLGFLRNTYPK